MTIDISEILARKAKREQEEEEDNRLLAENAALATQELKKSLESIAKSAGKHPLDLLGYDRDFVIKWANSQKPGLFVDDEEKSKFNEFIKPYKGKEFKFLNDKDKIETAKISDRGVVKASLVKAWRDNPEIAPI